MSQNLKRNLCLSAHTTYTCIYLYIDIIYIHTHFFFFFFSEEPWYNSDPEHNLQIHLSCELDTEYLNSADHQARSDQKVVEMMTLQVALTSHPWRSSRVVSKDYLDQEYKGMDMAIGASLYPSQKWRFCLGVRNRDKVSIQESVIGLLRKFLLHGSV